MQTISFMTANYVGRQVNYHMTEGWMQGENATQAYFKPAGTFATRFESYLRDIQALGFEAVDLWLAILHPSWATETHIRVARDLLEKYELPVVSLAGWFGAERAEFDAVCRLAKQMDCTILGGMTSLIQTDRAYVIDKLKREGLRLGLENHPEKTPEEMLAQIGDDSGGVIGTAVDTGWYGTQGYDAAQAIERLRDHLVHVHLKDVREAGGHETCAFGDGCVPLERCVQTLRQIGYEGPVCVEHEPETYDPTDEIRVSLETLKGWLAN